MHSLSLSHTVPPRSTAVVAIAALAGVAAALWYLARSRAPAQGIDPRRDRWDGEGPQAIDDGVVPS